MSLMLGNITKELTVSMKKNDRLRVSTLRFLLSEIRNNAIAKYGAASEEKVSDRDVIEAVKKQVKSHRESVEAFGAGGRADLVTKEEAELAILEEFLPRQLTDEELINTLKPLIQKGEKNFGWLMRQAMAAVGDKADSQRVSAVLKQLLQ